MGHRPWIWLVLFFLIGKIYAQGIFDEGLFSKMQKELLKLVYENIDTPRKCRLIPSYREQINGCLEMGVEGERSCAES